MPAWKKKIYKIVSLFHQVFLLGFEHQTFIIKVATSFSKMTISRMTFSRKVRPVIIKIVTTFNKMTISRMTFIEASDH